jgi:hypothetical protein
MVTSKTELLFLTASLFLITGKLCRQFIQIYIEYHYMFS